MPLFGKPKISEAQVASQFVMTVLSVARDSWPTIVQNIQPLLAMRNADTTPLSNNFAPYEFSLAAMTMQLKALDNLVGGAPAQRIRTYIQQCLQTKELGSYPLEAIEEYEAAWADSLSSQQPPHMGLAACLCERLELDTTITMGSSQIHDPMFLMAFAGELMKLGAVPFWKDVVGKYRIVA